MSGKKAATPLELLGHRLADRPQGTRCVVAVEPDHLIEWSRSLTDRKGREWEVVIYRGDDVVTRRAWQRCWGKDRPICLVLSRAEGDESKLQANSIADLVSKAEGAIVDLSLQGYFHALFPKVNPPLQTLAEYRREFVENVEGVLQSYPRFKERWGEPDTWGRGHFLAILALAQLPELSLEHLWCDDQDPTQFLAHAVWLLCHPSAGPDNLRLLSEIIWESSRHDRNSRDCQWLSVTKEHLDDFPGEISSYLVIRDTLESSHIDHLDTLIRARLLPRSIDPDEIGPRAVAIISRLKEDGRWQDVQHRSPTFLDAARIDRLADILTQDAATAAAAISSADTALPILECVTRHAILNRIRNGKSWPAWTENLAAHPLVTRFDRNDELDEVERQCASLLSAAWSLAWVERMLVVAIPAFANAEELLDWYVANRLHLLEYRVAESFARLESVNDPSLHEAGSVFVMRGPDGLRQRVRRFLNELDGRIAAIIRTEPERFMYGPRSAIRIIPNLLRTGRRPANQKVWILVMDGMRYDTWDAVLRPMLMDHFEVVGGHDRAYFSLLPSKTDIARRGLLATNLGRDWKNYFARPTKDERVLTARALGVPKEDCDAKVVFVTDAETTQAREKLGYDRADGRDFNILIYPISDDLGHYHNDTLAALNEKIRQQLRTQQGRRGIVDDLRWRIQPDDVVLITSDHGFQELFPEEGVTISRQEAYTSSASDEDVAYRYLRFKPKTLPANCPVVPVDWEEVGNDGKKSKTAFTLPVGGVWFQRERGRPARFAHGGVSLAEMAIPGVLLRPIQKKSARIELLSVPSEIAITEDESQELAFEIVNSGNVDARYELTVETNLKERLAEKSGLLPSGKREWVKCKVPGRYEADNNRRPVANRTTSAAFLTLAHADLTGKMIRPNHANQTVRVSVKPKATKIDTDALKAFDDL